VDSFFFKLIGEALINEDFKWGRGDASIINRGGELQSMWEASKVSSCEKVSGKSIEDIFEENLKLEIGN